MTNIGLLIPVCSRNEKYETLSNIPLFKYLLPSFLRTKEEEYNYKFYIGIDEDDEFYNKNMKEFRSNSGTNVLFYILKNCSHKPAHAWNKLLRVAYEDGCDYFFQLGDDIEIVSSGWTSLFIKKLKALDNIGIVGPCEPLNYNGRMASMNKKIVIENAFFHRTHYEIFKTLFHPGITNWYCDDWLSDVYAFFDRREMVMNIIVKNFTRGIRYNEEKIFPMYNDYLDEGITKLKTVLGV